MIMLKQYFRFILILIVLAVPNYASASLVGDRVYAQKRFDDQVVSTVSNIVQDGSTDLMFISPYTVNVEANSILISLSPSNFSCLPPCYFNGLDVYDLNWTESSNVKISDVVVNTNFSGFTGDRVTFGDSIVSFDFNDLICPISNCNGVYVNAYITTIPVPAAAWLFGTGLLGLIGVARRKA
jgi:hypothetical protein